MTFQVASCLFRVPVPEELLGVLQALYSLIYSSAKLLCIYAVIIYFSWPNQTLNANVYLEGNSRKHGWGARKWDRERKEANKGCICRATCHQDWVMSVTTGSQCQTSEWPSRGTVKMRYLSSNSLAPLLSQHLHLVLPAGAEHQRTPSAGAAVAGAVEKSWPQTAFTLSPCSHVHMAVS